MDYQVFQVGPISIKATKRESNLVFEYSLMVADVPPECHGYVRCSIDGCENYANRLVKASESRMVLLCKIHFEALESEVADICQKDMCHTNQLLAKMNYPPAKDG